MYRGPIGVALSVDGEHAAVVPVVVANFVLKVTSDVTASVAGQSGRATRVTLAVACQVCGTI